VGALTDPAFTLRYWGAGLHSDWKAGSPVFWRSGPDSEAEDLDQVVLVSEPFRAVVHLAQLPAQHAELFGWGEERLAELQKERRSKVTFDLEPADDVMKLTVTHDGFSAGSPMLAAWRGATDKTGGWPELLAKLKTLLETGQTFTTGSSAAWRARRSPEGRRHTGG
jgi:uncharacterized protein YndB with AHSA1/START domain